MDSGAKARATGGVEDDYYMLLDVPYRCGNNMMISLTELKLIRDMNTEIYEKIIPYLTVLPAKTKVNVNTASPEVLQAIFPNNSWILFAANADESSVLQLKTME